MSNMINGRTPEDIKKGLECRVRWGNECNLNCSKCDVFVPGMSGAIMAAYALVYIRQLEATAPKFISVEERLPEPFVPVLVHMPRETPHPTIREGYMAIDGRWYAAHFVRETDEITHWMPMPEAPKEEGD